MSSSTLPNTDVSIIDIKESYDHTYFTAYDSSVGPTSLGNFRGITEEFTNGDTVPSSGEIGIDDFRNRTWQQTAITNISDSASSPSSSQTTGITNAYWRRRLIKINFSEDAIKIKNGQKITGVGFHISEAVPSANQPFPNYRIDMKSLGQQSIDINPGIYDWTLVRSPSNFSATTTGFKYLEFSPHFTHSGGGISISFSWGMIPTGWISKGKTHTFTDSTKAKMFYIQTDSAGTYSPGYAADNSTSSDIPVLFFTTNSHPIPRPISSSTSLSSAYGPGLSNTNYERYIIKFNYSESLLNSVGITNGTKILQASFYITELPISSQRTFPQYQVAIKNTSISVTDNPGTSGWTVIRPASNITFSSTGEVNIFNPTRDLDNPFIYTGGTLSFSFGWQNISGSSRPQGKNIAFTGSSTTARMFYSFAADFLDWGAPFGTYTFASPANSITSAEIPMLTFKCLPSSIEII